MKPRTKFEKAVIAQSGHLRPLPTAPRRWAFLNTINHYAFRLPKGRTTCMDCGHSWLMSETAERCTCPNCKAKLKVKETYERKCRQKSYFNVITTCGKYQIMRMFMLIVEMRKGLKASPAFLEIGQYWIAPNGKTSLVAIQRTMGWYLDCFAFGSPFEIRNDNETYRFIADQYLYPKIKVIPELTRNGFDGNFHDIRPVSYFSMLLSAPQAEILLKEGNIRMLKYMADHTADVKHFWASYIIAKRHGYEIPNLSTWYDYLRMLERFGRDTHSPKLVAPSDLKIAHDDMVEKVNRLKEKERQEAERKKAEKEQAEFEQIKGRFFGLSFTDGNITLHTLNSVTEYFEVGNQQRICVWSAGYHMKPDTLVFVAVIENKTVATVEISLNDYTVLQCRGFANGICEYSERIAGIISENSTLIAKRKAA